MSKVLSFLVLMSRFSVGWWYVYCWRLGLRYICHPLHLELRMPILINCPSVCLSFTSQTTTSYRLDCCCTYTHNAHRKPKAAHSTLRIEKCTVKTAHCICPKTIYKLEAPCNDLTLHREKAFIDCGDFKPRKT